MVNMDMDTAMNIKNSFFSFFKQKANPITVDIHSHLLPNIDDGVRTIEESIEIIKKFQILGYTKLITTPHIMLDTYPNNREIITEKLHQIQIELKKQNIDIVIEASAEYYLDEHFFNLIENEEELLPFNEKYILFETAPTYVSEDILNVTIKKILARGYIPVLAHPERYTYLKGDIKRYKKLKAKGVLFQINIKSLYDSSKPIYKMALKLIDAKIVDFIGSDVHRMRDIKKIKKVMQSRNYQKILKKNNILNNI